MHDSFPSSILHANSAKVWIISESSMANDKNGSALKNYRKSYIFHANEKFSEQELIHLGSNKRLIGKYEIREDSFDNKVLILKYQDGRKELYIIQKIDNYNLTLADFKDNQIVLEFHSLKSPKL